MADKDNKERQKNRSAVETEMSRTERLALLFQRRYGILMDVRKLTEELMEEMNRDDGVSMDLLFDMRGDALNRLQKNQEEITLLGEAPESGQEGTELRFLIHGAPEDIIPRSKEEEQIRSIRLTIEQQLSAIKKEDRLLNQRLKSRS